MRRRRDTETARFRLGDRVSFVLRGRLVRGRVVGVQPPTQARYAVLYDRGVATVPDHGLRREGCDE